MSRKKIENMSNKNFKIQFFFRKNRKHTEQKQNKLNYNTLSSTSHSGGNLVDGLPPASSFKTSCSLPPYYSYELVPVSSTSHL